jgi:hypothetical protein
VAPVRRPLLLALALLALGVAGCGSSASSAQDAGTVAQGRTSKPPWPVEPSTVAARIEELGLPHPGRERFHLHALLHIYDDGLLVPVAADIGIDERDKIEAGLHTHDATGVIHMEADKPFRATLGDFFRLWGVRLSKTAIGGLEGDVHAYLDGRRLGDPAAHVLGKDDNIVLALGDPGSFPLRPDPRALLVANGEAKGESSCRTKGGETQGKGCSVEQP